MRHVLEHFLDPVDILKKTHSTLKQDGILYIAVPNNLNKNRLHGWARIPHTYYFNKYSLKNILSISSYQVTTIVEGDSFNKHEVFLIAKKSSNTQQVVFDKNNYIEQKLVFETVLKNEKSILYKLKKLLKLGISRIKKT